MKKIDVSKYTIKNKKIDKNLKIIFLSDLHNIHNKDNILKIIFNNKPDIIIFGGDMINESINKTDAFFDLVEDLKDFKIYYVFGNHEEALSEEEFRLFRKKVNRTNIITLYNDYINLTNNIKLIGLVSELDKYKKFKKLCLDKQYIISKVGNINKNKFNILIAHNPLEFDSYVSYGADLVLSGHIHGGLIRIPLLGGFLSPDVSFFPKYYEGIYKKGNTKMIVSRGLGHSERIKLRINNPFEIVIIDLLREE